MIMLLCRRVLVVGITLATGAAFAAPDSAKPMDPGCPMMDAHTSGVDQRGDKAMGFDHAKTTHHFLLAPDGGTIDVGANDAADTSSRDQIRMHLRHITAMFQAGDFTVPLIIHAQNPPGVPVMQRLKDVISYAYRETDRGGLVRIHSASAEAIQAIHAFLRFQIQDHRTGDPTE